MLKFNKLYVSGMGRQDQAVTSIVDTAISEGKLLLCETIVLLQEISLSDSEIQLFSSI